MKKRKILHRLLVFVLTIAMLAGICPQGVSAADILTTVSKSQTAVSVNNPRIVQDESMRAEQKVTWDCVYFGNYPQSEITSKHL